MERVIFLLLCILYSLLRGFNEAITMHFPNPRNHPLFDWYHVSRIAEAATLCLATWTLFDGCLTDHIADVSKMAFFLGVAILSWEAFELAYLLARCGQANGQENVLGVWAVDSRNWIIALHVFRTVAGTVLSFSR